MTVVVTDEMPENIQRSFYNFSNFNCIVLPKDKLYKMQQAKYPTFKWITEVNPTVAVYKIKDYLNRYNYINDIPKNQVRLSSLPKNGPRLSLSPTISNGKNSINILVSENIKDMLGLDYSIRHQIFTLDKISKMLNSYQTNIIITEEEQVSFLETLISPLDKILVLLRPNDVIPSPIASRA